MDQPATNQLQKGKFTQPVFFFFKTPGWREASLVLREMQMKSTRRYPLAPVIKRLQNI